MEEIKRISRDLVAHGAIIDYYQDTMQIPNGHVARWDFIKHKGAAAVVPVDDQGRIIMVRQYRNALERYTLEIPAGGLQTAEEPTRDAAARELQEETGMTFIHPYDDELVIAGQGTIGLEILDQLPDVEAVVVPVGGGGAWPGFEPTRRAKLAARTARGRAAAHGHTKQPGPTAGPDGARNTSGATQQHSQKSYEKYESFIGSS